MIHGRYVPDPQTVNVETREGVLELARWLDEDGRRWFGAIVSRSVVSRLVFLTTERDRLTAEVERLNRLIQEA